MHTALHVLYVYMSIGLHRAGHFLFLHFWTSDVLPKGTHTFFFSIPQQAFIFCGSHPLCRNLSNPSKQQVNMGTKHTDLSYVYLMAFWVFQLILFWVSGWHHNDSSGIYRYGDSDCYNSFLYLNNHSLSVHFLEFRYCFLILIGKLHDSAFLNRVQWDFQ